MIEGILMDRKLKLGRLDEQANLIRPMRPTF